MDTAVFGASKRLRAALPGGVRALEDRRELSERRWAVLALTQAGCDQAALPFGCATLLLPSDRGGLALASRAERVVSYGLSPRDSLTLSSLGLRAVLCVQRTLLRPDGALVEPQELPLPESDLAPEELLVAYGLRLLLE